VVSVRVAYGHSCEYICSIGGVISMCGTFVLSVVNGDGCAVEVCVEHGRAESGEAGDSRVIGLAARTSTAEAAVMASVNMAGEARWVMQDYWRFFTGSLGSIPMYQWRYGDPHLW